jgi:hypothetical protein
MSDRPDGASTRAIYVDGTGDQAREWHGVRKRIAREETMKGSTHPKAKSKTSARQPKATRAAKATHEAQGLAPDALELLERQHREVEALLAEFDQANSDDEAHEVASTICDKLTVHTAIEEEIFYPAARDEATNDLILSALEEHLSVKRIIADVQGLESEDERLRPKVNVLKDQVLRHVEEEERELFPLVVKEMDKDERRALGQHMQDREAELEAAQGNGSADAHGWPRGGQPSNGHKAPRRPH